MKLAVVYWTMTSNTEKMAQAIKIGAGDDCDLYEVSDINAEYIAKYEAIALGCPAMGDEVLEENEFEPFFDELLPLLKNQKVFLFGSYDWGDGQWMRDWQKICKSHNLNLIDECIISNLEPDDSIIKKLVEIGKFLSQ